MKKFVPDRFVLESSREAAVAKGKRRYLRETPCQKCKEKLFDVGGSYGYCVTCRTLKRTKKQVKAVYDFMATAYADNHGEPT